MDLKVANDKVKMSRIFMADFFTSKKTIPLIDNPTCDYNPDFNTIRTWTTDPFSVPTHLSEYSKSRSLQA
jgi:hypothetical protein